MPGWGLSGQAGLWHWLPSQRSPLVLRGEKLAELEGRVSVAPHGLLVLILYQLGSLHHGVAQASEKQGLQMRGVGVGSAGQEGPMRLSTGGGEVRPPLFPQLCPQALQWPLSGEPSRCSLPLPTPVFAPEG